MTGSDDLTMKKSPLIADKEGWRTVREESRYADPHVQVTLDEVFTPTRQDKPAKWTVVHRKAAVMITPMTPAGEILLVRQERIPARLHQWEFPAGEVDEEDSSDEKILRATAVRELQEETGYELAADGEMINLGVSFTSPGFTDEYCHMYLAKGVVPSKAGTAYDEGEGITECRAFGWKEFCRMVAEDEINDAHTLCAYARMCARGLV